MGQGLGHSGLALTPVALTEIGYFGPAIIAALVGGDIAANEDARRHPENDPRSLRPPRRDPRRQSPRPLHLHPRRPPGLRGHRHRRRHDRMGIPPTRKHQRHPDLRRARTPAHLRRNRDLLPARHRARQLRPLPLRRHPAKRRRRRRHDLLRPRPRRPGRPTRNQRRPTLHPHQPVPHLARPLPNTHQLEPDRTRPLGLSPLHRPATHRRLDHLPPPRRRQLAAQHQILGKEDDRPPVIPVRVQRGWDWRDGSAGLGRVDIRSFSFCRCLLTSNSPSGGHADPT